MTQVSGRPGESSKIRIRGIGTINASTDPLIVVDGVPYDGDMNTINPDDVESLTVLKDAASAALYGARGANGVVMITTKTGKTGSSSITFDAKWGSNSRSARLQVYQQCCWLLRDLVHCIEQLCFEYFEV